MVSQRGKIKSSSHNSCVNRPYIPENKKIGSNIARAQTWEIKADQVAGNHQTEKKCCRNLYLKKDKITLNNLNLKQESISFPWMKSAFQMCLSSDKMKRESKEVAFQQNHSRGQSTVLLRWKLKFSRTGGWILLHFSPLLACFAHISFLYELHKASMKKTTRMEACC